MSALTLAQVVATSRVVVGDTGTGRAAMSRLEEPGGKVNGTNKTFQVLFFPLVSALGFELRKNGVVLANPAAYTVDVNTGIITMVTAPVTSPRDILEATYTFVWFPDNDYYEFIASAATMVDVVGLGANPAIIAADVITKLPDTLYDAFKQFIGYYYNTRRADENAHRYAAAAGGQSVNVDVVTKNFRELAKSFYENGVAMREDFYKRRGAREAPAAAQSTFTPIISPSGPLGSPRR
jgi:hypothetical protein